MDPRILVATRKGLFTFARVGGSWQVERTAFLGDPVGIVHADPRDRSIYAALEHGHFGAKLHRSQDGGATFEEIAVPQYPAQPEGEEDLDPVQQKPIPWKLKRIWALAHGRDDQPGRLWAGTIPGGVFRSDDHGASWTLMESLWRDPRRRQWFGGGADYPGVHSVCVHPQNGRDVIVGVSCGGAWRTQDDGNSWEVCSQGMRAAYMPPDRALDPVVQDPHLVVQCPAEPDRLWTQHHNGVFTSADGGAEWNEIEPAVSGFGFAVAVHPREPGTAWFIPGVKDEKRIPVDGALVVTRTRDAGQSFDVLRQGLPQEHAYDIVFRHALDIDRSGDRLAFGSTTGNVWFSADQGDSWQTLSSHLPPVYCVRFLT